jgi:hypothetical protein
VCATDIRILTRSGIIAIAIAIIIIVVIAIVIRIGALIGAVATI